MLQILENFVGVTYAENPELFGLLAPLAVCFLIVVTVLFFKTIYKVFFYG